MFTESNSTPSMAVFSNPEGVLSSLQTGNPQPLRGDGVTIEDMKGNPMYENGYDNFDKLGATSQKLATNMDKYMQSEFYRSYQRKMAKK